LISETEKPTGRNRKLRLILKTDAIICLVVGLAMAGLAIAGPVAVWLGLADFRLGFGYLQIVNGWADWVAAGTLIVAIGIGVTALVLKIENSGSLIALALVGTFCAALAYAVPESFRPPEGTPPIHDITTNPMNPPEFRAIVPIREGAPNSLEYGSGEDMTPAKLMGMQLEAYPDIVPQEFDLSTDEVFSKAVAAAEKMGWEIVDVTPVERRLEATDTTFWFQFKDDIIVTIEAGNGSSVLNARSVSRVGRSDVGKNAERLREFFALLK
jgi:uncharacterized protein (DUF1499 family)